MPFDGSGNFTALPPPDFPAVAGEVIYAARFNAVVNDILDGLSATLPKDGQAAMAANLPMAGFKITGMAAGAVSGDAVEFDQWTTVNTANTAALATKQPLDADLTAIAGLATTGLLTRTGAGTVATRSLVEGAGVTITNANGVSGDITIAVSAGLGLGDVLGPVGAGDNNLAVFDGTTGKLLQDLGKAAPAGAVVGDVDVQTLTNKTISADSNTISGLAASSFALTNGSGNLDGAAATKAIPAGVVVGTTDTQTLTNKTLTSPTVNSPTISNPTFTDGYTEEYFTANTGTSYTIDLANGTVQKLTLTGNCTFTFPTATAGKSFMILLTQDGTGSRTVTWPTGSNRVRWPGSTNPTLTTTAGRMDKLVFTADGTQWLGSVGGQNYTLT